MIASNDEFLYTVYFLHRPIETTPNPVQIGGSEPATRHNPLAERDSVIALNVASLL
jgi:hypothetical protein